MIEERMRRDQLQREFKEDMRRKKVKEQQQMAAEGGRIGYAMGTEDKVEMAAGIESLPINVNSKGVKELDLRETGGFIPPVGIKEKVKKLNEGDLDAQSDYITARQGDYYDYDDYYQRS